MSDPPLKITFHQKRQKVHQSQKVEGLITNEVAIRNNITGITNNILWCNFIKICITTQKVIILQKAGMPIKMGDSGCNLVHTFLGINPIEYNENYF